MTAAQSPAVDAERKGTPIYGFYEEDLPIYSDEWTNELQEPVDAAELNAFVAKYASLRAELAQVKAERDEAVEALKKRIGALESALMDHIRCFDRPDKNPIVLPWWTKRMTERGVPKNSAAIQAAAVQIESEVRANADAVLRGRT